MLLETLLQAVPAKEIRGAPPQAEVTGLAYDSRRVQKGFIFAALPGVQTDGHRFINQAAEQGALAVLAERPAQAELCQIIVPDSRQALALLAHEFYGRPSQHMTCVGITGTNGKTTVSYLIESVLAQKGPTGVIGTVETRFAGQRWPAAVTTPESVDLQALLSQMRSTGVERAVMEISSHALAQHRADGIALAAGVFTNLSRDHLDYHGSLDAYFAAKKRLFSDILPASRAAGKPGLAVICTDDPFGKELAGQCSSWGLKAWTYGFDRPAMVRAEDMHLSLSGGACRLLWPGGAFAVKTPLVGRYNILNVLAAAAMGLGLEMEPDTVARGLGALAGVPGRLQRVGAEAPKPAVFVDYAHTDDALRQMLATLRPLTPGRLICVFGAGGDRDTGKRPLMGKAVGETADLAVLTSDNPRTEDPQAIMAMIEPGLKEAGARAVDDISTLVGRKAYLAEPDRGRAIRLAIAVAGEQDVVVIAGKGHEDYQIVGREKRHFDDREEAAAALEAAPRLMAGGCRA